MKFDKQLDIARRTLDDLPVPTIKFLGVDLDKFTQNELIKIVGLIDKRKIVFDDHVGKPTPGDLAGLNKLFNDLVGKIDKKLPTTPKFKAGNAVTVKPNGKSGVITHIEFGDTAWVKFPGTPGEFAIRFDNLMRFDYSKANK